MYLFVFSEIAMAECEAFLGPTDESPGSSVGTPSIPYSSSSTPYVTRPNPTPVISSSVIPSDGHPVIPSSSVFPSSGSSVYPSDGPSDIRGLDNYEM